MLNDRLIASRNIGNIKIYGCYSVPFAKVVKYFPLNTIRKMEDIQTWRWDNQIRLWSQPTDPT